MKSMKYRTITLLAAVAANLLVPTAAIAKFHLFSKPKSKTMTVPQAARGAQPPPYHWTLGAAPQAYKDMVAEFGKVGLKPGEYVWAAAIPPKATRASSSIC